MNVSLKYLNTSTGIFFTQIFSPFSACRDRCLRNVFCKQTRIAKRMHIIIFIKTYWAPHDSRRSIRSCTWCNKSFYAKQNLKTNKILWKIGKDSSIYGQHSLYGKGLIFSRFIWITSRICRFQKGISIW